MNARRLSVGWARASDSISRCGGRSRELFAPLLNGCSASLNMHKTTPEPLWLLYTGPKDYPGFSFGKTLVVIKIGESIPAPYLAFSTEALACYRLDKTGMRQHYSLVEFNQIDNSFLIDASRQALVFSSKELIDECWADAASFAYNDLLRDVKWPVKLD